MTSTIDKRVYINILLPCSKHSPHLNGKKRDRITHYLTGILFEFVTNKNDERKYQGDDAIVKKN